MRERKQHRGFGAQWSVAFVMIVAVASIAVVPTAGVAITTVLTIFAVLLRGSDGAST